MKDLIPMIAAFSERKFDSITNSIKSTEASLASRKLQEYLIYLEKRMMGLEHINHELLNQHIFHGHTRSLDDIQIDFSESLISFHQGVYGVISMFAKYLSLYQPSVNGRAVPTKRNKVFLEFLASLISDENVKTAVELLEKSREFRSEMIEHQPGGGAPLYDFGTHTDGKRSMMFYFTYRPDTDGAVCSPVSGTIVSVGDDDIMIEESEDESESLSAEALLRRVYPFIDRFFLPPNHVDVYGAVITTISYILVRYGNLTSTMPNRVSHFEIHADDLERCAKFYKDIFGWKITKWEGGQMEYMMVETGGRDEAGGINGGMVKRMGPRPAENAPVFGYVCTLTVDSYDAIHEKIMASGGTVALAKMALVGMAWQGYYKDTEGNIFGIHQPDTNAK